MKSTNNYFPLFIKKVEKRMYPYFNDEENLKLGYKLFKPKFKDNQTKHIISLFENINMNKNEENFLDSLNEIELNSSISLYSSINIIDYENNSNYEYKIVVEQSELKPYFINDNKKNLICNIKELDYTIESFINNIKDQNKSNNKIKKNQNKISGNNNNNNTNINCKNNINFLHH